MMRKLPNSLYFGHASYVCSTAIALPRDFHFLVPSSGHYVARLAKKWQGLQNLEAARKKSKINLWSFLTFCFLIDILQICFSTPFQKCIISYQLYTFDHFSNQTERQQPFTRIKRKRKRINLTLPMLWLLESKAQGCSLLKIILTLSCW